MSEIIKQLVGSFSQLVGLMGIIIIMLGLFRAAIYLFQKPKNKLMPFAKSRLTLGQHLILGLDFLVAKDVIDTFLLDDQRIWIDLAKLGAVVTIRIVLNHFLEKEIHQIRAESMLKKKA